ncbi:meiotic chromosome segregation protein [Schizosaccharomyces cryophilus OY26]|uniref:Meiotic chromosome segregation protein n=1 Tax=Schizosaccharomyces cryophilus (strain OY26 / ATCC MYA-4695 / CBS 11777 / NBRC 106824 / NRRL Y48691) TaxID=653667 RepID=S9X246_SCHCR|nr:meiotic chromosome segregation protein [Schizosaccharomyces cryophilus OY26]EPY51182.1 meiotic chromosome segregation protein [Schizosaccharomyces cryophilus OY26]
MTNNETTPLATSSQRLEKTKYNCPKPVPAYYPHPGSPIYANKELYTRIAKSPKKLVKTHNCAPRSGIAVTIPAKSVFRITTPKGPQVCDLNIWNLHNPRERFWAARTRQLHSAHVSTFDRLWSTLPYLRPLVTITADSMEARHDEWGGRVHDTLGTRCDPYVDKLISGMDNDLHCHSNLTRAIMPYGLTEFDVHDVLNVFQVTGLNERDQYFMEACPATSLDYFECFAEQDLLVAISACPGGDLSQWGWGESEENKEESKMVDCCRPLGIEVYQLQDEKDTLKGWNPPQFINYKGNHGLRGPQ